MEAILVHVESDASRPPGLLPTEGLNTNGVVGETSTAPLKSHQSPRSFLPSPPRRRTTILRQDGQVGLHCAHRSHPPNPRARQDALLSQASTVSQCAFREHLLHLISLPAAGNKLRARRQELVLNARVQRGPSEAARCASRGPLLPPGQNYTVKCCFTISALNSSLLPCATTAPLAMTTYFSASRAAK